MGCCEAFKGVRPPKVLKRVSDTDERSMDSNLFVIFLLGLRVMMDGRAEMRRAPKEDRIELCQRSRAQSFEPWPVAGLSEALA